MTGGEARAGAAEPLLPEVAHRRTQPRSKLPGVYEGSVLLDCEPDTQEETVMSLLCKVFQLRLRDIVSCCPMAIWLPRLFKEGPCNSLVQDAVCGLTVAAVLVPQGIAYGLLASLPPVRGLYTAMLPALAYMALGTCKHLSVGPFALISMLSAQGILAVVPDPDQDPEAAAEASAALALLVGLILVVCGALRLGFIATFLSDALLSGFCTASALLIPASQLKFAFQLAVPRGSNFVQTVLSLAKQIWQGKSNYVALGIFAASLLTIVALQKVNQSPPRRLAKVLKRFPLPAELIVVVASTAASYFCSLHACPGPCVQVLGHIPAGLPTIHLPDVAWADVEKLVPQAFVMALMTYIISMSVAKTFGRKYGYEVDNDQELLALGLANMAGCASCGYTACASLSRTAIAGASGAATPLHNLVTVAAVALVLLFCTELVSPLPLAALAAIVVMAFKSLLLNGVEDCRFSFRVSASDFLVWQIAFWATLSSSVTHGIAAAVAADLLHLFYKTTRPTYSVLGRLREQPKTYRNLDHFEDAEEVEGVLVFRLNGPLHFANREVFMSSLWAELRQRESLSMTARRTDGGFKSWLAKSVSIRDISSGSIGGLQRISAVVLDFSPVAHIDMSSCRTLDRLRREFCARNTRLVIAHCNFESYKKMEAMELFLSFEESGTFDVVCFRELHDAVLYAEGGMPGAPRPEPAAAEAEAVGLEPEEMESPSRVARTLRERQSVMRKLCSDGYNVGSSPRPSL